MNIFKTLACQAALIPMLAQAGATPLKITPLPDNVLSGASCALLTPADKVLTDGSQIIIDGRKLRTGKPTFGKKTKTWTFNGVEITYSSKGNLLEEPQGFMPGESKVGVLTIKMGSEKSELPAKEVCMGDV